jgi:hypothetical protein
MALSAKRPSKGEEVRKKILEDVVDSSEKQCRLNASIDETMYKKIKVRAAEEGRTISDITKELWRVYLSK